MINRGYTPDRGTEGWGGLTPVRFSSIYFFFSAFLIFFLRGIIMVFGVFWGKSDVKNSTTQDNI